MPGGRPEIEFDKRLFSDLIGLGCSQEEVCWVFRDRDTGIPANPDTLSRWCKRTYGMNYQEYSKKNKLMALKTQLRKNQLDLSKKSAAMAIFLGKQYLGQKDTPEDSDPQLLAEVKKLLGGVKSCIDEEQ